MKINIYALKDIDNSIFCNMCCGSDDKGVIKYYTDLIRSIYNDHCDDVQKKSDFLDRLEKTDIYKLGSVSLETGELFTENNFLCSFNDSEFFIQLKEDFLKFKKEKESDKSGIN